MTLVATILISYFPENRLISLNNKGKSGPKWLLNEQPSTILFWLLIDANIRDQLSKLYILFWR